MKSRIIDLFLFVSQQLAYEGTVGNKLNILLSSKEPFERSQTMSELKSEMNLSTLTNPDIGLNLYYQGWSIVSVISEANYKKEINPWFRKVIEKVSMGGESKEILDVSWEPALYDQDYDYYLKVKKEPYGEYDIAYWNMEDMVQMPRIYGRIAGTRPTRDLNRNDVSSLVYGLLKSVVGFIMIARSYVPAYKFTNEQIF